MLGAACTATRGDGRACRATPMRDEPFCFWHAPETAEEAAEARRLGGLHRRKKKSVAAVFGFGGLRTIGDNQASLETAAIETLAIRELDLPQPGPGRDGRHRRQADRAR
jgi:hypothetical protein